MSKDIIIAIDGYSGCGKSSTAKAVASALAYTYIDSGAMYRAVTLYFLQHQVDIQQPAALKQALDQIHISFSPAVGGQASETYLNGEKVENEIRQMTVTQYVSAVSALPEVRKAMVAQQRLMGGYKRVVMDGRDIGTHVFPQAELKIFMTAQLEIRARRRQRELIEKGTEVDLYAVRENLQERDRLDTGRSENPLRKAQDAIEVDTSDLSFEQQVEKVLVLAREEISQP